MEIFSENMLRARTHTAIMLCCIFPLSVPGQGVFFAVLSRKIFINRLHPPPLTSATCCRVAPVPNILRHRSTTSVVITRWRPPTLPCSLAAANPARVRSTINSRSISARALMTWKKNRPAGVEVSIESVRLRKFTPRA